MPGRDDLDCKIYVGSLSRDIVERDLEDAFGRYGSVKSVWVARKPSGFGFVVFEDSRDAQDAVRGLDGTSICGSRIRVEHSSGEVRQKPWQRSGGDRGYGGRDSYRDRSERDRARPFDPSDKCYECGERGHYAYDCRNRGSGGGGGRRGRSRSRSPRRRSRSHSKSRSRSRSRSRKSDKSRSRSRGSSRDRDLVN